MDKLNILLVSADTVSARYFAHIIQNANFALQVESDLTAVPHLLEASPYGLLLVDSDEIDATLVSGCAQARAHLINPILTLTESQKESQLIKLYSAGVDEVIIKPVGPRLLIAKIHAWLQRSWHVPLIMLENLYTDSFCLEPDTHSLTMPNGKTTKLTNLEYRLMHLLMSNPNRCLDSKAIIDKVWGFYGEGDSSLLKHLVYRLRRKIEPQPGAPVFLQTHPSGGYIFYPSPSA